MAHKSSKWGGFLAEARKHGLSAPDYALFLVRKHGSLSAASIACGFNVNTVRFHLKRVKLVTSSVPRPSAEYVPLED